MIQKLNHQEFIMMCGVKGINVAKITKKFVHISLPDAKQLQLLPNNCPFIVGAPVSIDPEIGYVNGSIKTTLRKAIRNGWKIECIKIIRSQFGLGLKESKDIVDNSMEEWRKICGTEAVSNDQQQHHCASVCH